MSHGCRGWTAGEADRWNLASGAVTGLDVPPFTAITKALCGYSCKDRKQHFDQIISFLDKIEV